MAEAYRRPELVPEYERLYRGKYAPGAYRVQVQRVAPAIKARVGFCSLNAAAGVRAARAEITCTDADGPGGNAVEITEWIVQHVDQTYKQGNWAGRGVLPALEGVTTEESAWRPNTEQKTVGEITLHMAYWKDAVTARTSGQPWEYNEQTNWRPVPVTARGWEEARAELQRAHERLLRVLRSLSPERLSDVVGKAWWLDEGQARVIDWAVGAAHHDMYHAAQIFVLRRLYQHR